MTARQKKRSKNEPTTGDKLHQAYRNRAAIYRVYEASFLKDEGFTSEEIQRAYWVPRRWAGVTE